MDAQATSLLTPEATTDEVADQIMAKLESANPEVEPETTEPTAEDAAPQGESTPEAAEPAASEQPPETPKHRVKVRGEEVEVTLDELLNGYSRTEDYKAKTAEVAEMRRTAEAEIAQQRGQQLAAINQALAMVQTFDPILAEGQKTDWNLLAQTDPTAYVQQRARFETRLQEVQQLQNQQAALQREHQTTFLAEQHRVLTEKLPEWASDEGRAKVNKAASDYLSQAGFTADEIRQVGDHRLLMMVVNAAKDRAELVALKGAQQTLKDKKAPPTPPKTQAPAASTESKPRDTRVLALKKQAMKTGRDDDIVTAAMAALGNH